MLQADIIEPKALEWASAPVLFRKHDDQVRQGCVDYMAGNNVTTKD